MSPRSLRPARGKRTRRKRKADRPAYREMARGSARASLVGVYGLNQGRPKVVRRTPYHWAPLCTILPSHWRRMLQSRHVTSGRHANFMDCAGAV